MAGGSIGGFTGNATATSATSVTDTGRAWTTDQFKGQLVVIVSGTASKLSYGVITTNSPTILTIDRWYDPAAPTGVALTAPSATATYAILPGAAPVWYMALTNNATAPAATDTALTAEITTAGGGLIRKAATYAHTAGTSSYTLTATFTVNSSDVGLPVTINKIGTFDSLTGATGTMLHETALSASATLSAVGDQLTVTQTVTM